MEDLASDPLIDSFNPEQRRFIIEIINDAKAKFGKEAEEEREAQRTQINAQLDQENREIKMTFIKLSVICLAIGFLIGIVVVV